MSAGLMQTVDGFVQAGYTEAEAMRYAVLVFFAGVLVCHSVDALVDSYMNNNRKSNLQVTDDVEGKVEAYPPVDFSTTEHAIPKSDPTYAIPTYVAVTENFPQEIPTVAEASSHSRQSGPLTDVPSQEAQAEVPTVLPADNEEARKLMRMGVLSAVVIFLHNIPEGVATFVSSLSDTSTGVGVAFAIAMHNIPEGLIIAVPIYQATKNYYKAFMWTLISGVAEPFGALLAYAILKQSDMHPLAYGFLFGLVAGIMVYISLAELLPTAYQYDSEGRVCKISLFGGMAVIAASILLFEA
eukprot:764834-Hanusia_phi.AAC.3